MRRLRTEYEDGKIIFETNTQKADITSAGGDGSGERADRRDQPVVVFVGAGAHPGGGRGGPAARAAPAPPAGGDTPPKRPAAPNIPRRRAFYSHSNFA